MRAPETIARAGHDGDASVKPDCHERFLDVGFLVMPALCRASTSSFVGASKQDVDGRDKPGHDRRYQAK
jgi:hypothetical protein